MHEKPTNTPIIDSVYYSCMVAPTYFGITFTIFREHSTIFYRLLLKGASLRRHQECSLKMEM
jgi:hypothetical protein